MAVKQSSYEFIKAKIEAMKGEYPSFRKKADAYVFSGLCIRANLYKNPAIELTEDALCDAIVDGQYDGGVDALLADPNSEESDMVIVQSKFYQQITTEEIQNALSKMAIFYKDMMDGHYEQVNAKVQRRFLQLQSEASDTSKMQFKFYTSASKGKIRTDVVERKFKEQLPKEINYDLEIFFGNDIEDEIKEAEARSLTISSGRITIDEAHNCLYYGDGAAMVNASAFSLKELYAMHGNNLLSMNLRYHLNERKVDKKIEDTISNAPQEFWLRNNGITIICDEFRIDGTEVKLKNFSIINGGQTTYMLHKSKQIYDGCDVWLPCKIIQIQGETEDERNGFSLTIAQAANTQKPIKEVDLKANSPEQVRFRQAMREQGIFYQTKRGEEVPKQYNEKYKNSDLLDTGKLCLAAIFQLPGKSRAKPSTLYEAVYYNAIFDSNQNQVARLCRELLYIDSYFRDKFQKQFEKENRNEADADELISFANNARTLCVAFTMYASRVYQNNITAANMQKIFDELSSEANLFDTAAEVFRNLEGYNYILPKELFADKDAYDSVLKQLFELIIEEGVSRYLSMKDDNATVTATNFLKRDKNYYSILRARWRPIYKEIKAILDPVFK